MGSKVDTLVSQKPGVSGTSATDFRGRDTFGDELKLRGDAEAQISDFFFPTRGPLPTRFSVWGNSDLPTAKYALLIVAGSDALC